MIESVRHDTAVLHTMQSAVNVLDNKEVSDKSRNRDEKKTTAEGARRFDEIHGWTALSETLRLS